MRARIHVMGAAALVMMLLQWSAAYAQLPTYDGGVSFWRRNMGGPRLGVTYVPEGSKLAKELDRRKIGRTLSQFGWHFEYQVIPDGGGPEFVVQFVPLVGGVEYGKVIPGATFAMGVRWPSGYEFGIGPNIVGSTGDSKSTSLIVAVGKSFNYGGVSIPLNLAYATNPDGNRISFIIGYAVQKRTAK
jgi:hypothetical protein